MTPAGAAGGVRQIFNYLLGHPETSLMIMTTSVLLVIEFHTDLTDFPIFDFYRYGPVSDPMWYYST